MPRRPGHDDMAGTLFAWPQAEQLRALARQRAELKTTIATLRPRSIKRLVLEERLRELTRLELQTGSGGLRG